MSKDAEKHRAQLYAKTNPSEAYDDYVIQDRPSLYSVEDSNPSSFMGLTNLNSHAADKQAMRDKLLSEIAHLEHWLSHQSKSRHNGSISLANTIRALIATRKSLLDRLQQ